MTTVARSPTAPPSSTDATSGTFATLPPNTNPDSARLVHLALGQSEILERIAKGSSLEDTLTGLLEFLERDTPEMLCSVLLLAPDGAHLRHCAAPSLPEAYCRLIDGSAIGPAAGSCGTAAFRNERVVVTDVETDPLWAAYRDLVRPFGLRACWSTPIRDAEGHVLGTFAMYFRRPTTPTPLHERLTDIALHVASIAIVKHRDESERSESDERYRLVNQATKDAVWDWDVRRQTLWWNDSVESLFGYPKDEVGSELSWWTERVHPEDRERVHHSLERAAAEGESWAEDYRFLRSDGTYADVQDRGYVMRDASGATVRMIGSMQDITERKKSEARIVELAFNDPLTGLPNRTSFKTRIADGIASASKRGQKLALFLVNLNGFRDINNCLGPENGDEVLREVANLLRRALGSSGELAALGGDEFAVLLPHVRDERDVEGTLLRIHDALATPIPVADIPIIVEATIGVAVYPEHGETTGLLWQHADVALRTAKEKFEPHLFYSATFDHYEPTRLMLLGELRDAIRSGQLLLHYQPKIDLVSGRTIGAEALVRWQHPTRGLLFPDTFIPLAERTGLINPLTTAVVLAALERGVALRERGLGLGISVNLSARNLHEPGFASRLLGLVGSVGFPLSELTLEVTETAIMADPVRAKAVLTELAEAGIHLSMDDFGIGQSSLSYLKELPISKIKIDKSFVMNLEEPRNVAVVRSAIDLARNMGLQVTAEGIENDAAYAMLRDFGCRIGQGYFFSRPLPVDRFELWLREAPWGLS